MKAVYSNIGQALEGLLREDRLLQSRGASYERKDGNIVQYYRYQEHQRGCTACARLIRTTQGISLEVSDELEHHHEAGRSERLFSFAIREKIEALFYANPRISPMQMRGALRRWGIQLDDKDHQLLRSNIRTMRKHFNRRKQDEYQFVIHGSSAISTKVPHFGPLSQEGLASEHDSKVARSNRMADITEWCLRHSLERLIEEETSTNEHTAGVIGFAFRPDDFTLIAMASPNSLANIYRQERQGKLVIEGDATHDRIFDSQFKILVLGVQDANQHCNLVAAALCTGETAEGYYMLARSTIIAVESLLSMRLPFSISNLEVPVQPLFINETQSPSLKPASRLFASGASLRRRTKDHLTTFFEKASCGIAILRWSWPYHSLRN